MKILAIDIGGTNVKLKASDQSESRKFPSGKELTPKQMIHGVTELAKDWQYDNITVGFPGPIAHDKILKEPVNLGKGWVNYDFGQAFGKPTKLINDAAMQALGSYEGGRMLFLGLGTGLGSAMVVDNIVQPMELGHLPYRKGRTYEDYAGLRGMNRLGKKRWRHQVRVVIETLQAALEPDDVVIGGGNAKRLTEVPMGCRLGDNANAFVGGFKLWKENVT
jgi:polyphosphate glucokinase